jgi:hypothetical protein
VRQTAHVLDVTRPDALDVPAGLRAHWVAWTGATEAQVGSLGGPGPGRGVGPRIVVVADERRAAPAWDGEVRAVTGVADPDGRAVVSVPPDWYAAASAVADGATLDEVRERLPVAVGRPDSVVYRAVYRWSVAPPGRDVLPDVGEWLPYEDPRVPEWLHPFGGTTLVVLDEDGSYLAGLGLKRHDDHVHEIAIGTTEAARGRGLARRLTARAARELLADGVVPTYMHDPRNLASAKVADAAGFPDRGWGALGIASLAEVVEAATSDR